MTTPTTRPAHTNRLAHATSPYLQQHQHNAVDWYEWGPAAFEAARAADKPIFLSIGYAACHWCHVMAHESFEDPAVAAVMNECFVNIKVDREERPDLDDIYMQATLVVNRGQGGWPMSVWLTPDGKPFFAGTYFPPTQRWGRPGFKEICERLGQAWRAQRGELLASADKLTEIVHEQLQIGSDAAAALDLAVVDETAAALARAFDAQRGGLTSGGSNKFPPSMALDVLLRAAARRPADDAQRREWLRLVQLTLDQMAAGGIYDQLAGGIHRYSTDEQWLVPHFEKMLYDQALVGRSYVDAFQFTGKPLYARIAREICDYVLADLRAPEGGFYSSRDADSEGQEGRYYVWRRDEVLAALGEEDGALFCRYFDVTDGGNWADPHEPGVPKNILRVVGDVATLARETGLAPDDVQRRLDAARAQLCAVRSRRIAPALDDKILCEWNGLMIATLARAGSVLGEPRYTEAAARAADFLLRAQLRDGRLLRSYRGGRTGDAAFLSDYACLSDGLLELYEATFDGRWLDQASTLNETALRLFWDDERGGFFFTARDHEALIARNKDFRDGATPSGNSVQLLNLLRLAALLGDERLRQRADQMLRTFAGDVRAAPWSAERFLAGVEFAAAGPVELVVVGPAGDAATQSLLRTIHAAYLPNRVLMLLDPAAAPRRPGPLLEGRTLVDGRPAAYVCRNYVCARPVTTADALAALLARPGR